MRKRTILIGIFFAVVMMSVSVSTMYWLNQPKSLHQIINLDEIRELSIGYEYRGQTGLSLSPVDKKEEEIIRALLASYVYKRSEIDYYPADDLARIYLCLDGEDKKQNWKSVTFIFYPSGDIQVVDGHGQNFRAIGGKKDPQLYQALMILGLGNPEMN